MPSTNHPADRSWSGVIRPHGGYRGLKAFQNAEIVYDATTVFCDRFISWKSRTHDQMVQAARSGKKNLAEGSEVSGTSAKSELKLVGVARGSLEELLDDYRDFLRQRHLPLWDKEDSRAREVRRKAYADNRSSETYRTYVEGGTPEIAANAMISLIHQTNDLVDQLLRELDARFREEGGFTERLYRSRHGGR